jgi:hypothetical protein
MRLRLDYEMETLMRIAGGLAFLFIVLERIFGNACWQLRWVKPLTRSPRAGVGGLIDATRFARSIRRRRGPRRPVLPVCASQGRTRSTGLAEWAGDVTRGLTPPARRLLAASVSNSRRRVLATPGDQTRGADARRSPASCGVGEQLAAPRSCDPRRPDSGG